MTVAPLAFHSDTYRWKPFNQLVSVEDWRGQGGDSSDTGTLLNAIAAAKAAGGMQLHLPVRHYTIEQTLLIDESHIHLIGEGAGYVRANLETMQAAPRTSIMWNGPVGGTIVRFVTQPSVERRIKGGLQGIQLDGNTFRAARGLHIESWMSGLFYDVMVLACSESHIRMSVVDYLLLGSGGATVPADLQRCIFEQCYCTTTGSNLTEFLNSTAIGWHLCGGSSVNAGNTSGNVFINCHGRTSKNLAWKLENCDDNAFYWCNGDAVYDPLMYGLELGSDDQDSSETPTGQGTSRFNFFFGFGGKIIARSSQTGADSSHGNMFFGYTRANNLPPPTIEEPAGGSDVATLYYWDTIGNSRLSALGIDETLVPPVDVTPRLAQLYVDGLAGPLKMLSSTGDIRQPLTAAPAAFPNRDQAPALYSRFMEGIGTPGVVVGTPSVVFSDDFSAGLGTWTTVGTAPVIEAAPWGSGQAIKCVVNSSASITNSYLSRPITVDRGRIVEFDLWLPQVSDLTPTGAIKVNNLMSLRPSGSYYALGLNVTRTECYFTLSTFETAGVNSHVFKANAPLAANTKYHVKMEMYQGVDATIPGRILLSFDGVPAVETPWSVPDHGQSAITQIFFGSHASNTGAPLTVYLGNLTVSQMPASSIANRITGSRSGIDFVGGWATGGLGVDSSQFVPAPGHMAGEVVTYTDQAPLIYSSTLNGAGTPDVLFGTATTVLTEDFSAGLGSWANNGVTPVFEAAPWGTGQAIKCVVDSGTGTPNSYLSRSLTIGAGRIVEFDMWLPQVSGMTTTGGTSLGLCLLRTSAAYTSFNLHCFTTNVQTTTQYYETPGTTLHTLTPNPDVLFAANTKYRLRYELFQAFGSVPGRLVIFLDDVLVGGPYSLSDSGQPAIAQLWFGAIGSNTGLPFTVYLGNLIVRDRPFGSIASRVTGTLGAANYVGGWATGAATISNYANDAAAATGGVAVGGFYRNGSVLMVRVA